MKYQKAQADIIFLVVMLFLVVTAIFLTDVIKNGLFNSSAFQAVSSATHTGQLAVKQANSAINIMNDAVAFLFVFSAIASVIAAAFTTSDSAFAVIGVILMPLEILFAFVFHDAFFAIMSNSLFAGLLVQYPFTLYVFQSLPIIVLILSIISLVVTFVKP
jgi:hypothetical protein